MIQIGKYRFGFAPVSMFVVFIVLSICAVLSAFYVAADNEDTLLLCQRILENECIALVVTLMYGVFAHFVLAFIDKIKNR
ncbi:MAG: hypothetical protein K2O88_06020 [Paramuribaculum sp.]|nr:hypothetical protein [Paramuribaculum sp.]